MRMTLLATAAVIGLGIAGTTASVAAPAFPNGIANAAAQNDLKQDVRWWHWHGFHWRRWHWRH